ncbi:hypothetical protein KL930_004740 [Ogataea haglerorum]|uniref:Uncharacterized protein n=1 Tax=Ogataea haglerorum TaxID=1937702 RepID=A0AAN6D1Z2_9ASCO|nr:uncharacterized protein KL911_004471 [Ogataea haglerorum]KAG7693175.1 hypothetical protein KL951_004714 [Ogataea haglerorum]KAG7693580.1 hypothetical protein KL915_003870 [Ogataea haglerorum]KAG7703417.1 hypothetical protein KL914_004802 [Ogataea haglerorum]KAG7703734.1 hypothetical protein KL950_004531 [Ogataea haglerorum]KAG7714420.1 hypothetical protein KL913_004617 [Ogataea haglerorum]
MTQTVYLVIGASRGIGLAIVKQLSENPDNYVIGSYRSASSAPKLLELAKKPNVDTVVADIASEDCKEQLEKGIAKLTDGIDVAIINAGISKSTHSILTCPREQYIDHFLVNTIGPAEAFKAAYPFLLKRNTRKVAFTTSLAGSLTAYMPLPVSAYGASKAALNYVVRKLSQELADENFSFAGLHPGLVATDMVQELVDLVVSGESNDLAAASFPEFVKQQAVSPESSASGIITAVAMLSPHTTGRLIRVDDQSDFPF